MRPEWRTSTVVALCRRMLDAREFDALPILADALQDAGCDDDNFLAACQAPAPNHVEAERLVNLIYSEETAAAVRWLEQFARDIGYEDEGEMAYTYELVVGLGRDGVTSGDMFFWTDAGAEFFYDDGDRRTFFRNWSLVTGVPVPEDVQARITFHCAC